MGGYQFSKDSMSASIQHQLFLLEEGDESDYKLKCDVRVCERDNKETTCDKMVECLSDDERNDYKNYDSRNAVENCDLQLNCLSSDYCFSNCAKTDQDGPSLAECQSSYVSNQLVNIKNDVNAFNVVDGIQKWTVPASGTYEITAAGASGGGDGFQGRGAIFKSQFSLSAGEQIDILVGQAGGWKYAGSGGGGSFVVKSDGTVLLVAAGGAGQQRSPGSRQLADGRFNETSGQMGFPNGGVGGVNGAGGARAENNGASGGGGITGDGGKGNWGTGGKAFVNGGKGGDTSWYPDCVGGFGGTHGNSGGGGGGGGYSGGGGGDHTPSNGGGGGSFSSGYNNEGCSGFNDGHGSVIVRFISARFSALVEGGNGVEAVRPAAFSWYDENGRFVESESPREDVDVATVFEGETSA